MYENSDDPNLEQIDDGVTLEVVEAVPESSDLLSLQPDFEELGLDQQQPDFEELGLDQQQPDFEELNLDQNPMMAWMQLVLPVVGSGGISAAVILALGGVAIPLLMLTGSVGVAYVLAVGASISAILSILLNNG